MFGAEKSPKAPDNAWLRLLLALLNICANECVGSSEFAYPSFKDSKETSEQLYDRCDYE